jgi:small acid-soluble spore protein (thioredoxin-like protein)
VICSLQRSSKVLFLEIYEIVFIKLGTLSLVRFLKNEGGILMSRSTPKPDDRSDNVEKLQEMVTNTIGNMEAAEESMAFADGKERVAIKEKNARREESISDFRKEIVDESKARENGYS